ncbi:MAG: ABC transporter substrate-binding protein, partial [Candidatus Competibacter denitrificans]
MKQKLLALAAAVSLIAGVTVQAADTVKIGLMAPLTGSWASEGQGMKKIVELLAEQQNAKGGVLGKQIEVITEDDGGDP